MLAERTRASRTAPVMSSQVARIAGRPDWRSTLARCGLVAKGVLYGALGWLALQIAAGESAGDAATRQGAIELVASQPLGHWLLIVLTIGLLALALWQILLVVTGDPVEGGEARDRVVFAAKALIYLGTAATALTIVARQWGWKSLGSPSTGEEAAQDRTAAMIMSWPGGPWIAGAIGLAVVVYAAYQMRHHGWERRFMRRLDRARMDREVATQVERAGRWGYGARATALGIIGVFFVVAAIQHDPSEAVGLSGALRALSQEPWGQVILWAVAIGLVLYGCFCIAEAKYRRAA
jgi:hypothetical protein